MEYIINMVIGFALLFIGALMVRKSVAASEASGELESENASVSPLLPVRKRKSKSLKILGNIVLMFGILILFFTFYTFLTKMI